MGNLQLGAYNWKRAKRARHYKGYTNLSWCGIYIYVYIYIPCYVTFDLRDWSKTVD